MRIRLVHVATMLGLIPAGVYGQVFLITGVPAPNDFRPFPSALVLVATDGSVTSVAELVPSNAGIEWITVSQDLRKALIFPQSPEKPLIVLDLDKATVVKQCQIPQVTGASLVDQWLADVPGRGPTFEWFVVSDDVTRPIVQGMIMDPSTPCEESFMTVTPSEIRYVVADGAAGVADMNAADGIHARIDKTGTLEKGLGTVDVSFDYQVPSELRGDLENPFTDIVINNSKILVVSLARERKESARFLAFRKHDKTWHRIPVQSDWYGRLRGFGDVVAVVEGQLKKNIAEQRGRHMTVMGRKGDSTEESAGRSAWRKKQSAAEPDLEESFSSAAAVYAGRLHLYNVETERLDTIVTNQADSEILLVESNTVYYRVVDSLYSAPITDKGIGRARLLATAELIRDAHWAFIEH